MHSEIGYGINTDNFKNEKQFMYTYMYKCMICKASFLLLKRNTHMHTHSDLTSYVYCIFVFVAEMGGCTEETRQTNLNQFRNNYDNSTNNEKTNSMEYTVYLVHKSIGKKSIHAYMYATTAINLFNSQQNT